MSLLRYKAGCDSFNLLKDRDDELAGFGVGCFDSGKEEGEDGAVVYGVLGAAEGEAALVAIDDTGGDPETKACAVEILGGVEGLEEARFDSSRHAVAGVGYGDADATAAIRVFGVVVRGIVGADEKAPATLTHGVDGVGNEIVEDLAYVVFKA